MQAPLNSGSEYYNYKKTHSIVLLAICNSQYEFIIVDIGNTGRISDGGVFSNSVISDIMLNQNRMFPQPEKILETNIKFPYVIVGDEAFP